MIDSILQEAQQRISSSHILSSSQLTSFLQRASNLNTEVSEKELIDAALDAEIYAHLGSVYQSKLDAIIKGARSAIISGLIQTPASLREYLESAASHFLGGYDPQNVADDLLIDARQNGLYEHLEDENDRLEALLELLFDHEGAEATTVKEPVTDYTPKTEPVVA